MAVAVFVLELAFDAVGLIPEERSAKVVEASVMWNYTTVLNIAFVLLAAVLVWRFLRTGGLPMLRMMNRGRDRARARVKAATRPPSPVGLLTTCV
jgi:uncharacterized protein